MTKVKKASKPVEDPKASDAQPAGGAPTVGGVTPTDPNLDPTTGLPFNKLPPNATQAQREAEMGSPGHPTTGGMTPKSEKLPAPAAEETKKVAAKEAVKKSAKMTAKPAAKPAAKVVPKKAAAKVPAKKAKRR